MKTDYSQLSKSQIKEKIAELTERIIFSYAGRKEKKENKKLLRKEIAKLKTELSMRRKRK